MFLKHVSIAQTEQIPGWPLSSWIATLQLQFRLYQQPVISDCCTQHETLQRPLHTSHRCSTGNVTTKQQSAWLYSSISSTLFLLALCVFVFLNHSHQTLNVRRRRPRDNGVIVFFLPLISNINFLCLLKPEQLQWGLQMDTASENPFNMLG